MITYDTNKLPTINKQIRTTGGFDETQVGTIYGCKGRSGRGNLDGIDFIVTAWQPTDEEIKAIVDGAPIFLTILWDALPPHKISTSFEDAVDF